MKLIVLMVSILVLVSSSIVCNGFTVPMVKSGIRPTTALNLEKWVADMIDSELYRQNHKQEYENRWMEKNRGAVLHSLSAGGGTSTDTIIDESPLSTNTDTYEQENFVQLQRDRRLAERDPHQYCADRCISTGNCDVYEDLYVPPKSFLFSIHI